MIRAVNATRTPIFSEGSVFETCTQKLRDLAAKIGEIFLSILRTILPCLFGKSETPVAAVVQEADPRVVAAGQAALAAAPAQNPAAAAAPQPEPAAARVEPAAAPAPAVVAAAAALPAAPAQNPAAAAAPQPEPAAARVEPAAAPAPAVVAAAAVAAAVAAGPEEPAAAPAAAAPAPGRPEELAAVEEDDWADWADAPPARAGDGARSPDHLEAMAQMADDNPWGPLARLDTHSSRQDDGEGSDGEGEHKVPARALTERRVPLDLAAAGVESPPAPRRAATAAPRLLIPKKTGLLVEGVSGLVPKNQNAGVFVVLSAILNLGRGVQEGRDISTPFLDAAFRAGVALFDQSEHAKADQIPVDDVVEHFEGLDEVLFAPGAAAAVRPAESTYKGKVDTLFAVLQETAIANRGFLSAVLCKGTEKNPRTFGLFIRNSVRDQREFFLVNPYGPNGKISWHRFVDLKELKGHFVREVAPEVMGNDEENQFYVIPLKIREEEEDGAAAAAAAPAGFGLRRPRTEADHLLPPDEMDEAAGDLPPLEDAPPGDEDATF